MKKTILVATAGLFATTLLGAQAVHAAPVLNNTDIPTEGTITFKAKTDPTGTITTPNENEELGELPAIELPGQGNAGKGNLRIQFVPNFAFGEFEGITAGRVETNATVLEYNPVGDTANKKPIAPFVQVTDERGETGNAAKWELSVSATKFIANKGAAGEDTLENAFIQLDGSTLTTTYGDEAKANTMVAGQETAALTPGTAVKIMSTKAGQDTNGLQVSNVFHNGYKKDQTDYTEGRTAGAKFIKPAGQSPKKDTEYKAILTWSLTDAL